MRSCGELLFVRVLIVLAVALYAVGSVQAGTVEFDYEFTGYSVAPADLESTFGVKVGELDAAAYGFDFSGGDTGHGFRNLNIISQVFEATQAVTIGTGQNGTPIELQPGDHTFAYTLDYTNVSGFLGNSAVRDFQLVRIVVGAASNPGPMMALGQIAAGGYNTDSAFGGGAGTPPFQNYPNGFDGTEWDFGATFLSGQAEYDWGADLVLPEDKAMVFMFTSPDVDVWQIGWGSENGQGKDTLPERQAIGDTGEGGSVIGGGSTVPGNIPLLIPVPEPASLLTFLVAGYSFFLTRRRKRR